MELRDIDADELDAALAKAAEESIQELNVPASERSRARVAFRTQATDEERKPIEAALCARFNEEVMVGRVEIELAREPEGWRVLTAWSYPFPEGEPWDARQQVIETLRESGTALAH